MYDITNYLPPLHILKIIFSFVTGGGAEQQPWRGQGAAPQQQYQPNQTGQNWLATARVGPRAEALKNMANFWKINARTGMVQYVLYCTAHVEK